MMDLAELNFGRYNGGSVAPIGSYWCPRNNAIQQLTLDGTLAQDGIWCRIDPSGTQTFANIATTINDVLSTSFTAGSFHAQSSSDLIPNPGQASNDA
jgi:hypothetical protein